MCNRVVARGGGARSVCRRMCSALVMYAFEALRWATITGIRCFQDVVGCGMSNHDADPEKTRVWRYKQPVRMQLST